MKKTAKPQKLPMKINSVYQNTVLVEGTDKDGVRQIYSLWYGSDKRFQCAQCQNGYGCRHVRFVQKTGVIPPGMPEPKTDR